MINIFKFIVLLSLLNSTNVLSQSDSILSNALKYEYRIFSIPDSTNSILYQKALFYCNKNQLTDALKTLDRITYISIDSSTEKNINYLKTIIYFKQNNFDVAYSYLNHIKLQTLNDSLITQIILIENLKLEELITFNTNLKSKEIVDSITILNKQLTQMEDSDCDPFYKKSKRIPGRGLILQKKYSKAFINIGLISSFLGYGIYNILDKTYLHGTLSGLKFAFQFYNSGATLSYNVCQEKQKKAVDHIKLSLYNLLLKN